jgi:hypothetical protein
MVKAVIGLTFQMSSDKLSYVRHVVGSDDKSRLLDFPSNRYGSRSRSPQQAQAADYSG